MKYLLYYLAAINVIALLAMGTDKLLAKQHKRRIPEKRLLLLAGIGGSVGALAGMYLFRHKTLHKRFSIGLPVILFLHLLLAAGIVWLRRGGL